jgi:hypothetical protein
MAVRVVSSGEGVSGVTQEAFLLILDWMGVRISVSASASPTLTQSHTAFPAAPAGD